MDRLQVSDGNPDPAKWRAVYRESGEVPVYTQRWADGLVEWYGSGTAVVTLTVLPIVVRLRYDHAGRGVRWVTPRAAREELTAMLRKITTVANTGATSGPGLSDRAEFTYLIEYLTSTAYPDGTAREPSALIIVADGNGWRGCVSDKDNGRTMWKAAVSLLDLVQTLEAALAADDPADWRMASAAKKGGKKRA